MQSRKNADMIVRRFFYAEDIPHFKVKSSFFKDRLRAVGEVGPSYKPPSYDALQGKELLAEVKRLDKDLYGVRENMDAQLRVMVGQIIGAGQSLT